MESNQSSSLSSKRATESNPVKLQEAVMSDHLDDNAFLSGHSIEKRMKKDDSGIQVSKCDAESSDEENSKGKESSFSKIADVNELSSPDSGNQEGCSFNDFHENDVNMETLPKGIAPCEVSPEDTSILKKDSTSNAKKDYNELDSDDDSWPHGTGDNEEEGKEKSKTEGNNRVFDPSLDCPKPKHKWTGFQEAVKRQYGYSAFFSPDLFRLKCYGSLHMVERLELMYKMRKHEGCVNALNFNTSGTKLASGSDDLDIIIWNWMLSEPTLKYSSGHRSNVFQAKFMPLSGDCQVVSCARDGQVRIAELSSTGSCKTTRKLAQHRGAAHKLSVQMDSPHTFLSCGEDAAVFEIDLREGKPEKLLICKEQERKVPLYSIYINPHNCHEYTVGGRDHFVRVYDKRCIRQEDGFLKKYCPPHMVFDDIRANVTSVVYSYNGEEILASFNDEDIYLFDAKASDTSKYIRRYCGHRNNQTVKGVNFFGPKSEFVISGSDCGHIFFWHKESGHIVKYMHGDEGGVVNCLEPHPHMPVLATSGLDDDIKIWVPSCEDLPDLSGLQDHVKENMNDREEDRRHEGPETLDNQMLLFLMHHLRRARRSAQHTDQDIETNSSSSESDSHDEDSLELNHSIQCSQS